MNERFESLMYHAGMTAQGCWDEMDSYQREAVEKFALLIVKECVNRVRSRQQFATEDLQNVTQAFDLLVYDIESHFGVKL